MEAFKLVRGNSHVALLRILRFREETRDVVAGWLGGTHGEHVGG